MEIGNFNFTVFFYVFCLSVIPFYKVISLTNNKLLKAFISLFCCSFFVYSGIGIAFMDNYRDYLFYYTLYVAIFSLSYSFFSIVFPSILEQFWKRFIGRIYGCLQYVR